MNRSTLRSLSAVVANAVVSLFPVAAGAQPTPAADMTAEQVRADFLGLGYLVEAPSTWRTNNHVTTFTVSDRSGQGAASGPHSDGAGLARHGDRPGRDEQCTST
jgi:hypothetical protein